jgi:TPR repeat protein
MHAFVSAIILTAFFWSFNSVAMAGLKEGIDAYYDGRYGIALKELRPLAEDKLPEAEFYLGVMYAKGRGVPQDFQKAVHWYRLAAAHGFPKAMSNLGGMYSKGHGVPKDYAQAIRWYEEAAEQQLPEAQYNLGVMYKEGFGVARDLVQAHMWFNLSASQGHREAYRARILVSRMMTPEQISAAQKLAREWRETKESCLQSSSLHDSKCP